MASYAKVTAAGAGASIDGAAAAVAGARSAAVAAGSPRELVASIVRWRLGDVFDKDFCNQLGPIPDTFSSAGNWAAAFLPYIAEEARATLCQSLVRLAACKWLPLDGTPRIDRDDDRKQTAAQTSNSTNNRRAFCTAICDLNVKSGRSAWRLSGAAGGDFKVRDSTEECNAGVEQKSPLKPTDLVLLTNSRERDVNALTAPGTVYALGVVRKICRDKDDEDGDSGGVRVSVFAPEDGELDSVLSLKSGSTAAVHVLDQWYLVLVGNVATATRIHAALALLLDTVCPVEPPLLQVLLCRKSTGSSASCLLPMQEVGSLTQELRSPSPRSTGPIDPAAVAVLQAVEKYCRDVRHLNVSQQQVVLRAARPHVHAKVSFGLQDAALLPQVGGGSEAGDSDLLMKPEILLVQGPPGTGKTSTTAGMLSVLSSLSHRGQALLVCAPTNAAVAEVATRFMSLMTEAELQQFAALPLAGQLRKHHGWPIQAPLLSGDCLLLGREDKMDMSLAGPLQRISVRARAARLMKALSGPKSWRSTTTDLRRLLGATRDAHSQALAAAHAAASTSADRTIPPHTSIPITPGGFLKKRLPAQLETLRQTVKTILEDFPSAVWNIAVNDDGGDISSSAVCAALNDKTGSGRTSLTQPDQFVQQRAQAINTAGRVDRGRASLARLVELCGELEDILQHMTPSAVTAVLESQGPLPPLGEVSQALDGGVNDPAIDGGGSGTAGGRLVRSLRTALRAVQRASQAVHLGELEEKRRLETKHVLRFCVRNARLIFSTVSAVGSGLMASATDLRVATCVVDEAAQLTEAELGIVLVRFRSTLRQLVLIGDPKQLPATVLGETAAAGGYGRSAFERLQLNGWEAMLLNIQYRMHPAISAWPRTKFYGGRVLDGPNVTAPHYDGTAQLLGLPWGPYVVVDISDGREEREDYKDVDDDILGGGGEYDSGMEAGSSSDHIGGGVGKRGGDRNRGAGRGGGGGRAAASQGASRTSPRNMYEAAVAVHLAKSVVTAWRKIRQQQQQGGGDAEGTSESTVVASVGLSGVVRTTPGVSPAHRELLKPGRKLEIGIISPYRAQVDTIYSWVDRLADPVAGVHVAVRSVDGFQGQEQDVIVLSLVRANDAGTVGFTADPRRLNVAATRARHALVVLLHAATMRADPLWTDFMKDAENRGVLHRAESLQLLAPALKSVQKALWHQKVIQNGSVDLFKNQPWQVVLREEMQASVLKLSVNQRVRVFHQLLSLASGRIPARILPFNAVRPAYADVLHVFFLEGRLLALVWSVRLWALQKGGWCQALQVWNVLPIQRDDTELRGTVRRAEAEYDMYTDEHLDALGTLNPPDVSGLIIPKYWHGELPFPRTRPKQARALAQPAAAVRQDGRRSTGNAGSRGDVDEEEDGGHGGGLSRSCHYVHAKHFLLTAAHARQLCLAAQGSIVERMYELTPEQKAVVADTNSVILIGRSGTGKTSVIIARVLQYEEASAVYEGVPLYYHDDQGQQRVSITNMSTAACGAAEVAASQGASTFRTTAPASPPQPTTPAPPKKLRQMIVTLSPILAVNTAKYLRRYLLYLNRTAVHHAAANATTRLHSPANNTADTTAAPGGGGSDDGSSGGGGGLGGGGLLDEEEVTQLHGSLPERLSDVADTSCPLVLDLRRFLEMLDASLDNPFKVAQRQRAEIAAARTPQRSQGGTVRSGAASAAARTALASASRMNNNKSNPLTVAQSPSAAGTRGGGAAGGAGEGSVAARRMPNVEVEEEDEEVLMKVHDGGDDGGAGGELEGDREVAVVEVDYDRFAESYWPHFNSELRKQAGGPALVWREAQSDIKGSLAALSCPNGWLTKEKYLALAKSRAGAELSVQQRESVYVLFKRYEQEKERRGEYDIGDLTTHIHVHLAARGYPGQAFRFVYADEVQDLTPAQVALFKYICPHPEDGFVLAGDTAQTIAKGVNFRFEALKDLLYGFFLRDIPGARVPHVTPLLENFRTHAAISRLAHYGVLEPLLHFFPHSLDKLPPESSNLEGPRPLFLLPSCGNIRDMLLLNTPTTTSATSSSAATDVTDVIAAAARGNLGVAYSTPDGNPSGSTGHEVVVLVPNEDLKHHLKRYLLPSITVLTALESKGLEYKVVLLYNFFSASRFKPDKWRLLHHVLVAQGLEPAETTAPGGRLASPRFDPQAHSLMAPELKALYVAVTRGREDVVVVEGNEAAAGPVQELWSRMGLVDVRERLDDGVLSRLQRQLSKEELRQRARDLYSAGLYSDAAIVFDRFGDETGRTCCEAQIAKLAAKKAFDRGQMDEARKHYSRAGESFARGGKHPQAALCFERAVLWGEAGDEYYRHCGDGAKAAECYEKAKRWRDAAARLAEIRPLSLRLLERFNTACCKGAEFHFGVEVLLQWESQLAPVGPGGVDASGAGAGGAEVSSLALQIRKSRTRLASLGAVYWKDQPGGREEMMSFVRLMLGEGQQRRWLNRYHLYDLVLKLDIEAGHFLLAAVTCERKGDVEQAVQLYVKSGRVDLAVELLLSKARAAVLWSGSGGGGKAPCDWPPQQPGGSGGRYLKQVKGLLQQARAGGATGTSDDVSGMRWMTDCNLESCELEVDMLSYISSSSAKSSRTSTSSRSSGAGEGSPHRPLEAEWAKWKTRLEAIGLAATHGSRVALVRLCLLRLLSGDALVRLDSLIKLLTPAPHVRPTGTHAASGRAVPGSTASVLSENLPAITTATQEVLRLWSAYRRFLADILRTLSRQQVAAASDRDAAVLAAVQSYHVVTSSTASADDGDVSTAAGGGGLESSTSYRSGGTTGGVAAGLHLGCPATAVWVLQAKERLGLTLSSDAVGSGGTKSAVQLSSADFAAAASLYWFSELMDRSKRTLECLLALAEVLVPDYEAFKAIGASRALEIGDRGRRHEGGGGGQAASGALDMTQLRAQVLAVAVQEAEDLLKMTTASNGHQSRRKSEADLAQFAARSLPAALDKMYRATACLALPALEQMGNIPAARQAAAEALDLYGREILKAAAVRPNPAIRQLSDSKRELLWERPQHTKLSFEDIARVAILQPLLPEGWLLRVANEGFVDWETSWGSHPDQLSAWQLLLESVRAADCLRNVVPICREAASGGHKVMALARFGSRALLNYYNGVSVTAQPRTWNPWAGMQPLTFLTLLERYTLLGLPVISRGADNLVVPTSLVLDHFTQPGVTELLSYCVQHANRVSEQSYNDIYDTLYHICELLSDLSCRPERVCPVNQLHGTVLPPVGPPLVTRAGGNVTTGAAASEAFFVIPKMYHGPLGMFLRRTLVLLFTVAVNVRRHPRTPAAPPSSYKGAAPLTPLPPTPPPSPAESCLRVVKASGSPVASLRPGPSTAALRTHGSSFGLADAMPLLPCTLRLLLDTLRVSQGRYRGNSVLSQFEPPMLGPEFSKTMFRGRDRLLRLYRRSAPRVGPSMSWATANRSFDVEEWREVEVEVEGANGQRTKRQVAFFRLPNKLLNTAAENIAGGDLDEDKQSPPPPPPPQQQEEEEDEHAAAPDGSPSDDGVAGEGMQSDTAAAFHQPDTAKLVAAAANRLGRTCFCMTRLWLCRARQQMLLPRLSLLQQLRRAATVAFHDLMTSVSGGGRPTDASRAYVAKYLEVVCPLQMEVQQVADELKQGIRRLQLKGPEQPQDETATAQVLDTALEYADELAASCSFFDIKRHEMHRAFDGDRLSAEAAVLRQLLGGVRHELGPYLRESAAGATT